MGNERVYNFSAGPSMLPLEVLLNISLPCEAVLALMKTVWSIQSKILI